MGHLHAQEKDKDKQKDESNAPVFTNIADDPTDPVKAKKGGESPTRYFLFPEFYAYWPIDNNDTILKYECYDANHNVINMDTLHSMGDVYFISFIKKHTDYTRTIITEEGQAISLPVSRILYKYERTGQDAWKGYDLLHEYTSQLQENKSQIVRADSSYIVNAASGARQLTVRKYYKVLEIEKENVSTLGATPNDTKDASGVPINYFNVPEFYFHTPKKDKDTTLEFLSYDSRDSLIPSVTNFDSVRYFSLYKSYTDSAHTYVDSNGQKQLLPVSAIVRRYDRIAKDKWMSIEYPSNKYTELKEFKSVIVRSDTESTVDIGTMNSVLSVYNYYKVIK